MFPTRVSCLLRILAALIGVLPWAFAIFGQHTLGVPLFRGLCHQSPERTLVICGAPMDVCSRCAGIYAGIAIGAVLPPFGYMARHGRTVVWIAISVVLLDVAVQNYLLNSINHGFRIATGLIAGWTAFSFLFSSIEKPNGLHGASRSQQG